MLQFDALRMRSLALNLTSFAGVATALVEGASVDGPNFSGWLCTYYFIRSVTSSNQFGSGTSCNFRSEHLSSPISWISTGLCWPLMEN